MVDAKLSPLAVPVSTRAGGTAARIVGARDLAVAVALLAAAIVATRDAWRDILRIGLKDEELSYVLLAPVVIGSLAYIRRQRLARCRLGGGWAGLVVLASGWFIHWYGYRFDPVIWRAGGVVTAAGAVMSALGTDVVRQFAPAFVACAFLIPVDPTGRYHVAMPMQVATAEVTQRLCDIVGMNVERSGNMLSVNGVGVTIAEACNGMRMILTLFMVCYVVAFAIRARPLVRALVLAASPVFAIVSNVLRLVPTVWMFGHTSHEAAERFHDASGWAMTVVAFLLLMGLCHVLQGALGQRDTRDESSSGDGPRATADPSNPTTSASDARQAVMAAEGHA